MSRHGSGFTLDESARRIGHFRWLETRMFEILGGWAATTPEADVKLLLARQSAHHGWHTELLEECLPSTKDHDPGRLTAAPSPGFAGFLDSLAAETSTVERLAGLFQVLVPEQIATYERHLESTGPVADAANRRLLRFVVTDEVDHLTEGLAKIEDLVAEGGASDVAASARDRFATLLVDAGGLG